MFYQVRQLYRPIALVILAFLFSPSVALADLFTCENGRHFYGQFAPDGSSATLQLSGEAITFKPAISASGARYISPGGFELWGKGNSFLFTAPGLAMTRCLRKPGKMRATTAQLNSAPSRKINKPARIWHTQIKDDKVVTTDCKDDCEEDIGIMLECTAPNRPIIITVPWASGEQGRKDAQAPVQFELDGRMLNYRSTTEYWGMIGYLPKLQLPLSDPLFNSLAQAGRLIVHFAQRQTPISMRGASKALTDFYSSCATLPVSNVARAPQMTQPPVAVSPGPAPFPSSPQAPSFVPTQGQTAPPPMETSPAQGSAPQSRDGLIWQYYENVPEGSAWLSFGIPETDATTVTLECRKNQPNNVRLTFPGAPAGLQQGVPVQLIIRLPDWSLRSFRAMVDQRGFVIANSDLKTNSLFAQLAGVPGDRKEIFILVNGQSTGRVQGYANSSQGKKFQSYCKN